MQALVQCEMMLTDLAVTNIGVDDTAAAAKVFYKFSIFLENKHWLGCGVASPINDLDIVNRLWP